MNKVKSLTLSIDEIDEIFSISDPQLRETAIRLVKEAAADPENFDINPHLDGDPLILNLLWKILRRAETARLRAEARERRKAEAKSVEKVKVTKEDTPKSYDMDDIKVVNVPFNESVARRFLWLRQHLNEVIDNILRVIDFFPAEAVNRDFVRGRVESVFNLVKSYLKPLINFSADYMRMPRQQRPALVPINVVA